jgi:GT2 family glycosyltransferase
MEISIVIATRWDESNISHMIECFQKQSFQDFEVIFVIDKFMDFETLKNWNAKRDSIKYKIISNLESNFIPSKWVSYVRNFWIDMAKWEFINLMDDDEDFDADYLQKSLDLRKKYRTQIWKNFVLTPKLIYRKTWQTQSQWFKNFNWFLWRPTPYKLKNKEFWFIQMYSCNSLFGPNEIFKTVKFDEKIDFVNEDLDFTYRIYKNWYPIITTKKLEINHMEREKNELENRRIGNEFQAYRKARHKIMFVNKNWKFYQKTIFYIFWLPIFMLASIVRIIFIWKDKGKISLIKSLFKWIFWMRND